jgi:hypothetical protein
VDAAAGRAHQVIRHVALQDANQRSTD